MKSQSSLLGIWRKSEKVFASSLKKATWNRKPGSGSRMDSSFKPGNGHFKYFGGPWTKRNVPISGVKPCSWPLFRIRASTRVYQRICWQLHGDGPETQSPENYRRIVICSSEKGTGYRQWNKINNSWRNICLITEADICFQICEYTYTKFIKCYSPNSSNLCQS